MTLFMSSGLAIYLPPFSQLRFWYLFKRLLNSLLPAVHDSVTLVKTNSIKQRRLCFLKVRNSYENPATQVSIALKHWQTAGTPFPAPVLPLPIRASPTAERLSENLWVRCFHESRCPCKYTLPTFPGIDLVLLWSGPAFLLLCKPRCCLHQLSASQPRGAGAGGPDGLQTCGTTGFR